MPTIAPMPCPIRIRPVRTALLPWNCCKKIGMSRKLPKTMPRTTHVTTDAMPKSRVRKRRRSSTGSLTTYNSSSAKAVSRAIPAPSSTQTSQ